MATKHDFVFRTEDANQAATTRRAQTGANALVYMAVVLLVMVTAFLMGVMYEREASPSQSEDLATFWQAWDILEDDFYGDLPAAEERRYGAIEGLVNSLEDPFTTFAPPEVAEVRRQQIDGHFGGVGIVIRATEDFRVVVVSVIPENPAAEAGIEPGDIFMSVDGQNVENLGTDGIANLVRGEIGTEVELTMYRPEQDETYTVMVERAIIETPTVFSEVIAGNIGYVQLSSFSGVALSQMEEHLDTLADEDIEGLILDLRGNGGGLLDQAIDIADLFLADGTILIQRSSDGTRQTFESTTGGPAEALPMVVLTDGTTASAAEVVAGALQDRERAALIGQPTFGKGVVQLVYNLADGSQLRVTSSAWYTPSDRAIHLNGLDPDVALQQQFDTQGNDLARQAGIAYLHNQGVPDMETEDE